MSIAVMCLEDLPTLHSDFTPKQGITPKLMVLFKRNTTKYYKNLSDYNN